MATTVPLGGGGNSRDQLPPRRAPAGVDPESGAIVRYLVSPQGRVARRELLTREDGHAFRPHTTRIGKRIYTTWDEDGRVMMQIDRLGESSPARED